jgi:VacB/RNase II family 3'-5' exoribonuclease
MDLKWPKFIVKEENEEEISKDDIYTIKFSQWKKENFYPIGKIKRYLGNDIHAKIQSILIENEIKTEDFQSKTTKYLKKYFNKQKWNIPKSEIENRKDFRNLNVFTIDDESSKDLDDAISIRKIEESQEYEIGVHISDVSFFIPNNSLLDFEAKERCSSIYLPSNEIIPMLPLELSEDLCSLLPNQERLTISIIFNITENGFVDPLKIKYFRSIIKSKRKFSYTKVEKLLKESEEDKVVEVEDKLFVKDLQMFHKITQILRKLRLQNGSFEDVKFNLKIVEEKIEVDDSNRSKQIIQELMLLTNSLVSKKMNPSFSIFRNHSEPNKKKLDSIQNQLNSIGLNNIDFKSTFSNLNKSLLYYKENSNVFQLLNYYLISTFETASYGTESKSHFGLNLPSYCHFTSPIRRYPDLLLHRLFVQQVFNDESTLDRELFQNMVEEFNAKQKRNKKVEEEVFKLYFNSIISNEPIREISGIISNVDEKSIKVLIIKFDLEQRITFNQNDILEFDQKMLTLKDKRKFKLFDTISVEITCKNGQIKFSLIYFWINFFVCLQIQLTFRSQSIPFFYGQNRCKVLQCWFLPQQFHHVLPILLLL